ncbi:hypothetical protein XELAEV_18013218mg [Xenopus laevis]|uniref:Uncharacterized protein n=1 Tax=Xenopus laevis TaxID=8355 RepID=A0A974DRQ6_XENLA|nr:hypothetical protein XELAEV_18013218mg [Xenopus laevis]
MLGEHELPVETPCRSLTQLRNTKSCHLKHLIRNISFSQLLHLRWICSKDEDFIQKSKEWQKRLRDRGCASADLEKAFKKAAATKRENVFRKYRTNVVNILSG